MAYSSTTVLDRFVTRLNEPNLTENDYDIFADIITSCEDFVTIYTHKTKANFPDPLMSIVTQMALETYNQMKSEGYQNETIEGITIRYQDIFEKYQKPLGHYRKLVTL